MIIPLAGLLCFVFGSLGLFSIWYLSSGYLKGNATEFNFYNFFKSNGSKLQYYLQLVCGIIVIAIGSNISKPLSQPINQVEQLQVQTSAPAIEQSPSNNSPQTVLSKTCDICGRSFAGDGFCEDAASSWNRCKYPYSTNVCSITCGLRAAQKLKEAADRAINGASSSSRCVNCGLGHYVNGFCDMCGAASPERVNESRSRLQDCPMCHGTGIERPMGATTSDETGRICPACNGTGKQAY